MNEITKLIESLYAVDRALTAVQEGPNEHVGILLHAGGVYTLKLITQNEGIGWMELSEQVYRTEGATSVMVDKLVEKGLVNCNREEGSQKRCLLALTELGRIVNQAYMDYDDEHVRWVAEGLELTEGELQVMDRSLNWIIEFYSENCLDHGMLITPDRHR